MWKLATTPEFEKWDKWYQKKRPRERGAVLVNLSRYLDALNLGTLPKQIQGGWIHPEPKDVVALSQQGGIKNAGRLQETRLYLFPDVEDQRLYVITIGDKDSQSQDIRFSCDFVDELLNQRELKEDDDEENRSDDTRA